MTHDAPTSPLSLADLTAAVAAGSIDTVLVAMTDMQGRLQGKRYTAGTFLDEVVGHGSRGCAYLVAVDVDMTPVDGYAITSWERGYGDFVLAPDLNTLRRVPWLPGTALCLADATLDDGRPVDVSPRQVLARQLERLAERGWSAVAATELEFLLFEDGYETALERGYRGLRPANRFNSDYSILATSRVEPFLRDVRNAMLAAGIPIESSKGECNLGQHEINVRYGDALQAADHHVVYKNGLKEMAAQRGLSVTFMAKYDGREGNSSHLHLSLRSADGQPPFGDPAVFEPFLAGQLACLRELSLLIAPNVNSYKRFAAGSFAPTAVAWGRDNRTCALRVVGRGASRRFENRVPGADVNPYLALAATVAAGLHGVDAGLRLEPETTGSAYAAADAPRLPTTLREARDAFAASEVARAALGDEVVAHYVHMADVELAAFEAAVTDWELGRGFERL